MYSQCGGLGYTGWKTCRTGSCCHLSDYFSQCLEQCPDIVQLPKEALTDSINVIKAIFANPEGKIFSFCILKS